MVGMYRRLIAFLVTLSLMMLCAVPVLAGETCNCGCQQVTNCNQQAQNWQMPPPPPTYQQQQVCQTPYLPQAGPVTKPNQVSTQQTNNATTTTWQVVFGPGETQKIVEVPGVGVVLANINGAYTVLK